MQLTSFTVSYSFAQKTGSTTLFHVCHGSLAYGSRLSQSQVITLEPNVRPSLSVDCRQQSPVHEITQKSSTPTCPISGECSLRRLHGCSMVIYKLMIFFNARLGSSYIGSLCSLSSRPNLFRLVLLDIVLAWLGQYQAAESQACVMSYRPITVTNVTHHTLARVHDISLSKTLSSLMQICFIQQY